MHLLASSSATLDDLAEPIDLGQTPADMLALSFTDSDLSALAASWDARTMPSLRLASLRDLRHPMSVDLWIERTASRAKIILVRLLGGYEWWRYGCDQLAAIARQRGIELALLPGESHETDERLAALSTLPTEELAALLAFFREGGPENMRGLLLRLAGHVGGVPAGETAKPLPKVGFYDPERGIVSLDDMFAIGGAPLSIALRATPLPHFHGGEEMPVASLAPFLTPAERGRGVPAEPGRRGGKISGDDRPIVPILFYRSMLLSADVAPIDALAAALRTRGMNPVPIFVPSLKDADAIHFVEEAVSRLRPALLLTATAFASGNENGTSLFDRMGVPVMQIIVATTRREAWESGQRGLAPADLAMHAVLPELDGRILAGVISLKAESEADAALGFRRQFNRPEPDRVEGVADRVAAFIRLQRIPRTKKRVAILIPDYPGAAGRTGYAVGLDVPASVIAMLHDLKAEGYRVEDIPDSPRGLLKLLEKGMEGLSAEAYVEAFPALPTEARANVEVAWGPASEALSSGWSPTLPPSVLPAISPTRGEIGLSSATAPTFNLPEEGPEVAASVISPPVGEMAALRQKLRRPEGGNVECMRSPVGRFALKDGRFALGLGLPFGQTSAEILKAFAIRAEAHGVSEIRFAPGRALLAIGLTTDECNRLKEAAQSLGFVTDLADPRLFIAACAGSPACASAFIETKKIAAAIAHSAADLLDGSFMFHVSGCPKGCARPSEPALSLTGIAPGKCEMLLDGHEDAAIAQAGGGDAAAFIAELALLFRQRRRQGETSRAFLDRSGGAALASALRKGR